ncbi:MAG: hypothetical protein LBI62_01300 [Candidatus Accumulibacter sp.]|jgi:hypothetical protein|nr:hypothetical protein [Accumulibacter sp.]
MREESVLVLNNIEKMIAGELIRRLDEGIIPDKGWNAGAGGIFCVSYEYHPDKQQKIVRGIMLGCPYKLRYKDDAHVFFSAWDCKDVCSIFYDMVVLIGIIGKDDFDFDNLHWHFAVDMHTESYVFSTGELAGWIVRLADYINKEALLKENTKKVHRSSQYVISVFDEPDKCAYSALMERLKAEAYSMVRILELWIRGEILYYVIADGVVLRPQYQRRLTPKEEADVIRKAYKIVNDRFRLMEVDEPEAGS